MIDSTRLVNRLQDHIHGKQIEGETIAVELSATQIQAAKILLDKSLPSLQSADITAHSLPQMETDEALKAKLLALIRSDPLLIKELVGHIDPHTLPAHPAIEHTQVQDDDIQPLVSDLDVHTQQSDR